MTLVEVEPDGDLLPTRGHYDPAGVDYAIALNPLTYEGRLWYMLPDVLAATILNPRKAGKRLRHGSSARSGSIPRACRRDCSR